MNRNITQIVFVILGALISNAVYCADEQPAKSSVLQRLEDLENILARVERLEEREYGEKRYGPLPARLEALEATKSLKTRNGNFIDRAAQIEPGMNNNEKLE